MKRNATFLSAAISILVCLSAASQVCAMTYHLGAQRDTKTFAAIAPNLKPGDVVEVDPGTYHETAKLTFNGTQAAPIIIRGLGAARPVFDAQGLDTSGRGPIPRGVFEITGAYIVLEHLEFKNARNGNNAAGVRFNDSLNAIVRDCKVTYCDMGIFGGDRETVHIENCEIAFNGTTSFNGFSHNFYMHGNRVVVRNCYIHDSLFGQNYKTRAHYNELWFNWITDSNEGEVGCVDEKGLTDQPNSNVLMVGNTIVSKPERTGNPAKYVLFGSESGNTRDGTLYLFYNTFIAGSGRVRFITLDDPKAHAVIQNNLLIGSDQVLNLARSALSVTANHNLLPKTATTPDGWTDKPGVPLVYTDGDGRSHTLDLPVVASPSLNAVAVAAAAHGSHAPNPPEPGSKTSP